MRLELLEGRSTVQLPIMRQSVNIEHVRRYVVTTRANEYLIFDPFPYQIEIMEVFGIPHTRRSIENKFLSRTLTDAKNLLIAKNTLPNRPVTASES